MSYELYLVRGQTPEEIEKALERSFGEDATEPSSGDPTEAADASKRRLADLLKESGIELKEFIFDHTLIARELNMSEAEARMQWRHIELNNDTLGLQIQLYDDTATVALPFWHSGGAEETAWSQVWRCLRSLSREGQFVIYDPQLDRALDVDKDMRAVIDAYKT
jgi:hypothetical protein